MNKSQLLGYCKECGAEVYISNEVEDGAGVYECGKCDHPHALDELWDKVPYYIREDRIGKRFGDL